MKISNDSAYTLSQAAQQAVRNGAINAGIDANAGVIAKHIYNNDDAQIFDIYDTDENYVFSIDTDGNVIFEK